MSDSTAMPRLARYLKDVEHALCIEVYAGRASASELQAARLSLSALDEVANDLSLARVTCDDLREQLNLSRGHA